MNDDARSFEKKIGMLYAQLELDCVVELAIAVALDSKRRPDHYTKTCRAPTLTNLTTKVGKDPDWPDYEQRMEYYSPLFGASSSFNSLKNTMLEAARRYAERVFDTGEPMLKQAFVDKAIVYRAGLSTRDGAVIDEAYLRTTEIYSRAVEILKDDGVAAAFGLPAAKNGQWPFDAVPSGEGAVLAGAIAATLSLPNHSKITAERFLMQQLVAVRGKETIMKLPKATDDNKVVELIKAAYSWQTSNSGSLVRGAGTPETIPANSPRLATSTAAVRRQQ